MNPIPPIAQAVRNYFNFKGRASRSEFWWLFVIVLFLEALFIAWQQEKFPLLILGFLKAPFKFVALLPFVHLVLLSTATVRRLHDTDRSAKWPFILMGAFMGWLVITSIPIPPNTSYLIPRLGIAFSFVLVSIQLLLPIAVEIVILIMLSLPGTKGANRYGPDPLLIQNREHARDSNVATPDETCPPPRNIRRTITRKIIPALLVIVIASTIWFLLCGREAKLVEISSGNNHVCGIKQDGSPECWGFKVKYHKYGPQYGQHRPPKGQKFTQISSGLFHTCALRMDGTPICWGHEKDALSSPFGPAGLSPAVSARKPKLEPYTGVIDRILEDDLRRPRKQRHTAKRERLRDEYGFDGGYTTVKDYVRENRRQRRCSVPCAGPRPTSARPWWSSAAWSARPTASSSTCPTATAASSRLTPPRPPRPSWTGTFPPSPTWAECPRASSTTIPGWP